LWRPGQGVACTHAQGCALWACAANAWTLR
jgi:hypothetical protein